MKKYECPKCKNKTGIAILYGYPSPESQEKSRQGELKLGGCIINGGEPKYYCIQCHHEWGSFHLGDYIIGLDDD